MRGTSENQLKPANAFKTKVKGKNSMVPLYQTTPRGAEVYSSFKSEYDQLEEECFVLLDQLVEKNPFCAVCFTGYSFGGGMATLAATRYANARPTSFVSCVTIGAPKVGAGIGFKRLVNSTSNLKVIRVELGQDGKCQLPNNSDGSFHVGHTLALHWSLGQQQQNSAQTDSVKKAMVRAYKFDAPKQKAFKTIYPDLKSYIRALEHASRGGLPWPEDFVGQAGDGVVVNNEKRLVV